MNDVKYREWSGACTEARKLEKYWKEASYARYRGNNARKWHLTYVTFMLTYVRHCFRRIRVFDDWRTCAGFPWWFTYVRWTVMYVRSGFSVPEHDFWLVNVRDIDSNVREVLLTYFNPILTYVSLYFLYISEPRPFHSSFTFFTLSHHQIDPLTSSLLP